MPNKVQQGRYRERNRLKKEPPPEVFYSYEEFFDTICAQTLSTPRPNCSNAGVVLIDQLEHEPHQTRLPSPNQPSMKLQHKSSTGGILETELKHEDFKRMRAKTPVYRVGQLENKVDDLDTTNNVIDATIALAQQYQAILPAREATPCPKLLASNNRRNNLRRVKCQDSLRSLVNIPSDVDVPPTPGLPDVIFENDPSLNGLDISSCFSAKHFADSPRPLATRSPRRSFDSNFSSRHSSDSETLLDSDSAPSPNSSISHYFSKSDLYADKMIRDSGVHEICPDQTTLKNEIGMELAMDLLTNDLATALRRQHPLEPGNRASGLQILLMIEAYESLQQKVEQERAHETEHGGEHVSDVLDHWLQALRSIYERLISTAADQRSQEAVDI